MNTTFGIGNVLGTGFRVWFKNFVPFMVITAVVYSPLWIWGVILANGDTRYQSPSQVTLSLSVLTMAASLLSVVVAAALTYGVVMELQGRRASIGACIGTGLARFLPVLGTSVLCVLAIAGATILLIIPGIMVACMLYVAVPASVIERGGALARSRELTRGHRWAIFGLVLIVALIGVAVQQILSATVVNLSDVRSAMDHLSLYTYVSLGQHMVLGSLGAVMNGVAYCSLRADKEGTSAAELAAIFD